MAESDEQAADSGERNATLWRRCDGSRCSERRRCLLLPIYACAKKITALKVKPRTAAAGDAEPRHRGGGGRSAKTDGGSMRSEKAASHGSGQRRWSCESKAEAADNRAGEGGTELVVVTRRRHREKGSGRRDEVMAANRWGDEAVAASHRGGTKMKHRHWVVKAVAAGGDERTDGGNGANHRKRRGAAGRRLDLGADPRSGSVSQNRARRVGPGWLVDPNLGQTWVMGWASHNLIDWACFSY